MEYTKNGFPLFDGKKYALWNGRIQVYILHKDMIFGTMLHEAGVFFRSR